MLRKTLVMLTAVLIVALPAYADVFKMDLHASYGATSFHTCLLYTSDAADDSVLV